MQMTEKLRAKVEKNPKVRFSSWRYPKCCSVCSSLSIVPALVTSGPSCCRSEGIAALYNRSWQERMAQVVRKQTGRRPAAFAGERSFHLKIVCTRSHMNHKNVFSRFSVQFLSSLEHLGFC